MNDKKNAIESRQFRNFKCQFAVGGKDPTKKQSTVKDEARDQFRRTTSIIDFPSLGTTYNGGWCSATKTR